MKRIKVNASNKYEVVIGSGLLDTAGEEISKLIKPCKLCILTDDTVAGYYLEKLKCSLTASGYSVSEYIIPHGEESKNISTYAGFLNYLASNGFTRTDALAALGGGVVGDLCGFTAATYLRGVKYVQIPTTILAMVDSSVGGKTAVDLEAGKNLCGAFYQPTLVLCDCDTSKTLPSNIFADGMAEVIKYGVIRDSKLFEHLYENKLNFDFEYVIETCVDIKRDIVENDEFDNGIRQLLNFGHTVGHGIEKLSNFGISHGSAVAIGMMIITKAAAENNICSAECITKLNTILNAFSLPTSTEYTASQLAKTAESDKKRRAGNITLVIPKSIGQADLMTIPTTDYEKFIAAGV